MPISIDLSGRVAVVTGAGGGIGRATALVLAEAGADLVIPDVDLKGAEQTAADVKRLGRDALSMTVDVTKSAEVTRMVKNTVERFGRLDILVNNAGINTKFRKPFYEQPEEDWMRVIEVDVKGTWLCSKAACLEMIKQRTGRIVNISSIAGRVALRLQSNFVAAKAGVIRLTEAMALELAPYGIAVNCVAPGSTLTEGVKRLYESDPLWSQKMLTYIPFGRAAKPEEIGHAVLFLASDLATYITGETLVVDGGWTAGNQIRDV
jgi:NAD(P)-dependent dehydrogenase (short-subunit alcohol dehydrogenase family)